MEEMIAAGVMMPGALDDLPGGMGRQRRRDFGEKPKLWEVWVDEQGQIHEGSESDFGGKEESKWEDILPVSAIVKSKGDDPVVIDKAPSRRAMVSRILSRRPELPTPPRCIEAVSANDKADDDLVQVSVFISMPNPSTRRSDAMMKGKERIRSSEEGEFPAVVLGIAEVGYRV